MKLSVQGAIDGGRMKEKSGRGRIRRRDVVNPENE